MRTRSLQIAIFSLAVMLMGVANLAAQSVASAYGNKSSLWIGGEYANLQAGFPKDSSVRLTGAGAWVDYNWRAHWGVEARARFMNWGSWHGETEQSFLAGPRYTLLNSRKWRPFAAFDLGITQIHYPFSLGDGNSLTLAPRGGVEYKLSRKLEVRATYEMDFLTNSPDFTNEPKFGIHPSGVMVGAAWRIY